MQLFWKGLNSVLLGLIYSCLHSVWFESNLKFVLIFNVVTRKSSGLLLSASISKENICRKFSRNHFSFLKRVKFNLLMASSIPKHNKCILTKLVFAFIFDEGSQDDHTGLAVAGKCRNRWKRIRVVIIIFFSLKRHVVFNGSFKYDQKMCHSLSCLRPDFNCFKVVLPFYSSFYHCSDATSLASVNVLITSLKMSSV